MSRINQNDLEVLSAYDVISQDTLGRPKHFNIGFSMQCFEDDVTGVSSRHYIGCKLFELMKLFARLDGNTLPAKLKFDIESYLNDAAKNGGFFYTEYMRIAAIKAKSSSMFDLIVRFDRMDLIEQMNQVVDAHYNVGLPCIG